MKKETFEREVYWYDEKNNTENLKASTDEGLNKQVKELKEKICELEGKLRTEEKQSKAYKDFFDEMNLEVKPKTESKDK